ncbi:hypothetical protein PV328_001642 [Microctonus aethiopoides]|uniref:Small subunit processome component 20 homolog n=1 Tax=Microctonus aethiopoides TaxID=144406 RepID=A0AA39FY24_9HYME|nr:hypothetical protein PV328_001642 [Microctonus aethiopoides]
MKNKPIRHKETNTFKFKKFSDRIAEIDVDVFHRVIHKNEEINDDEDSLETNFYKTLQKWNPLNLTEGFTAFKKEVRHVITLPQLIIHKNEIIESLTKCLKMKDVSFVQPILELVVALAKDLQKDFYDYFPHFLTLIIDLFATKNPEILDPAFTTLAYLFKFLWRYLVKYINTTFELLLPLLVDTKPEYVNNFAAESFAFVARKVRDRESFLQLVFDTLKSTPDGTSGCGKLLFEVIAGTQGQFHSCAEQMIIHYLKIFINESIDDKLAYDVLQQIFTCITEQINPKHCQILWTVIFKVLDEYSSLECNEANVRLMKPLISLIRQVIIYKGGRMLLDPTLLISKIIKATLNYNRNDDVLRAIIDLSAAILLADNVKLSQETSYELISTLLEIEKRELLNYAVENLINHSSFETLVLPMAMQKSVLKNDFSTDELRLFAKIVTIKAPPCVNGESLKNWRRINLDFRAFPTKSMNYLVELLQKSCDELNDEEYLSEDVVKVLIILPHINPQSKELIQILQTFFQLWHGKLIQSECKNGSLNEIEKRSLIFLLATGATIIHNLNIDMSSAKLSENNEIYFGDLITKFSHIGHITNTIDLFVTHMSSLSSELYINTSIFDSIIKNLGIKFTSPDRRVRMAVSHLVSLYKDVSDFFVEKNSVGSSNALELIFMAEKIETSVYNYRDRLIHLRALSYESPTITNLKRNYRDIPLRYLLGNFFINFSLLWDPVAKIIATYANEDCTEFWPIFRNELETNNSSIINSSSNELFNCSVLKEWMKSLKYNDKPDLVNYKILLWKCMSEFPEYCEARNRDLTVLFINFVEDYYFKMNSETSKSFSIVRKSELNTTANNIPEDEDEDDEECEDEKDKRMEKYEKSNVSTKSGLKKLGKSSNFKLLQAQLNIFAKMQNPKMLYREPEMNKIYMDILTSKSVELQKLALDCLLAYKHKHLMPYKDHLYGLIDEKNLRNELARFKVADEEETTGMIQAEHREALMPILMRLMYAKMITRGTGRSGGAVGAIARRKIILRFLMGVKEEEMMLFTKMAFKPFERYDISLSPNDEMKDLTALTTKIINELDLSNIIPPKRLKSAANLLAIIMEEFGAKMSSNLLPRLLAILICILAQVKGILDQSDKVLSGFLPTIKELRTNCIGIVARFFGHFENYNWTSVELDALFNVAVFPWLHRLPIEGIHSPTTLLKLFSVWCQNPRYFCLLVKHEDNDKNMTCLPYIMKLLLGNKTHPSVVNMILEMIEKLLTLQDYGTETEERMEIDDSNTSHIPLQPRNILDINSKNVLPGYNLNYGSAIILPYVPDILLFIKRKLEKSRMGVNRTETTILARISELNLDPATSDTLLSLSLPILVKRAMRGESEEIILELLTTIVNLMKNVNDPQIHVRSILPLLYSISSLAARKLLMQLLKTIAMKTPDNANISRDTEMKNVDLLISLNAMDQRWIDQADFEKRLGAFSEIKNMVEDDEINSNLTLDFGVAVIYNCYYFLKHESDLSLKDSAGHCLNILGPKLAMIYRTDSNDRKYLIEDTILNLVRNGIRGKNDTIRLRSISFLGIMSMKCSDIHPVLRDLNSLTDKNDPEVDFFENLQHLQLHRKARALLKFCSISKKLTKTPSAKTLTQFIFPLASSYLCNESFANKNSIIDAAIETVGTVCRLLPWHQYSIILKHYLDKLRTSNEFQRQIVRIVVAILDSFHYDLSKLHNLEKDIVNTNDRALPSSTEHCVVEEKKVNNDAEVEDIKDEESKDENEDMLDMDLAEASDDEKTNHEIEENGMQDENNDEAVPQFIMEKQIVLSPYAAKRVVFDITHTHLPQLHRSILTRTHHEMSHKVNRKRTGSEKEEEELMRVPIALAVVKLLQKLPEGILNKNLPGIFMKLCTFLKSRLDSVRRATREILQKIMITLGPNYLHHLLREMNSLLTKGFQIHVLAFTIHAVLISLKPYLKPIHMSENLQSILQVCNVDLFGMSAEEKEVIGITKNISEAKSTKSFDIFHILGLFIDESCLLDLIEPLNNVLNNARSHKTVRKVIECLRHIVLGLADNSFIQNDRMLIFLYGVVSKSIPSLNPHSEKDNIKENKNDKSRVEKSDCYIIAPEPKSRMGIKTISKTAGNTNDHVMLEFGLKLFHILLKREKVTGNSYALYLDPFVTILANCLNSQHVKLSTLSLQCLNWIIKMNLDSVHTNINEICATIFKILHKYGSAGLGKGDNFDLVMAAFKTMSVLVRDVKHFEMTRDQTKALILYAEQDLHDSERQATAFNLIKAIIGRKIVLPEIHGVMNKVAALSVTSESENVRQQCRVVFYHFLMDYPLGKRLDKHLSFYLSQLSYELQTGRLSALEMIYSIITGFPENILIENSGLLYVMIGARLVNDEDPTCRKLVAKCINELITRVPHNQRVKLFDIVLLWLKDDNVMHRRLAAQLCGIFVTIEKESFESRLESVLPLILKQFHAINADGEEEEEDNSKPGRFVRRKKLCKPKLPKIQIKDPERAKDHHAFQVLQLTLKISANCSAFLKSEKYIDSIKLLAEYSQSLLGHPHLWVRLAATQQIGFILATIDEEKIMNILKDYELKNGNDEKLNDNDETENKGYIYSNPVATLRSLTLDLLAQLQPGMEFEELANQVVKNLVFIARVIKSSTWNADESVNKTDNDGTTLAPNGLSILWLVKRIRKCINVEITQNPNSTAVRTAAFKWTAGIIKTISVEPYLKPILFQIMSPLVREMTTTEESNAPLRQLSKEVAKMIKNRIDDEEYMKLLAKVQQKLDIRRAERKKTHTQQFVIDPELAAKRKIARQQKKKEAKKRKMSQARGKKFAGGKKSKKNTDLEII